MWLSGQAFIDWKGRFADILPIVERAFSVSLCIDRSGDYEEFPAYVGESLGIGVALLDRPGLGMATERERATYQLRVKAPFDYCDEGPVVDISEHLVRVLTDYGLSASADMPAEGDYFVGG